MCQINTPASHKCNDVLLYSATSSLFLGHPSSQHAEHGAGVVITPLLSMMKTSARVHPGTKINFNSQQRHCIVAMKSILFERYEKDSFKKKTIKCEFPPLKIVNGRILFQYIA